MPEDPNNPGHMAPFGQRLAPVPSHMDPIIDTPGLDAAKKRAKHDAPVLQAEAAVPAPAAPQQVVAPPNQIDPNSLADAVIQKVLAALSIRGEGEIVVKGGGGDTQATQVDNFNAAI